MKKSALQLLLFSLALAGCATYKNELLFAESTDVGLSMAPNPAGGSQFVFGYKQRDLALIPVGAIDGAGEVKQRRAVDPACGKDAVSVFGQFSVRSAASTVPAQAKRKVALGRFFATGVAAVNLAEGYRESWIGKAAESKECPTVASDGNSDGNSAIDANGGVKQAGAAKAPKCKPDAPCSDAVTTPSSGATQRGRPLPPMVFGQYDTFGLTAGVGADAAEGSFTIGYSGRNIAIMPVFASNSAGEYRALGGKGAVSNPDAFSVIGQFKADSDTATTELALDRFFATGIAAQRLSEGLRSKIVEGAASPKQ